MRLEFLSHLTTRDRMPSRWPCRSKFIHLIFANQHFLLCIVWTKRGWLIHIWLVRRLSDHKRKGCSYKMFFLTTLIIFTFANLLKTLVLHLLSVWPCWPFGPLARHDTGAYQLVPLIFLFFSSGICLCLWILLWDFFGKVSLDTTTREFQWFLQKEPIMWLV